MMDKFGVAVDETVPAKTASRGGDCPSCGGHNVNYSGSIPHCPRCGTEPWEPHGKATHKQEGSR